jgi:6-phosphogluconolactonase
MREGSDTNTHIGWRLGSVFLLICLSLGLISCGGGSGNKGGVKTPIEHLYVVNTLEGGTNHGSVSDYQITPVTGTLVAQGNNTAVGTTPETIVRTLDGKFLYVANDASANISILAVDQSSGALTSIGTVGFSGGSGTTVAAMAPTGAFLFIGSYASANVSVFSIDPGTGALSQISGSPFSTGPNNWIAVHPSSKFLYTANFDTNTVSAYSIDAAGRLSSILGSPFAAGINPISVAADPSGSLIYVSNYGSRDLSVFLVDSTTGSLSPAPTPSYPTGINPRNVVPSPNGKFVYVLETGTGRVHAFSVDPTNIHLNEIAGSPFNIGDGLHGALGLGTSLSGDFVYATDNFFQVPAYQGVFGFTVGPGGTLSPISGSPFPSGISPLGMTSVSIP